MGIPTAILAASDMVMVAHIDRLAWSTCDLFVRFRGTNRRDIREPAPPRGRRIRERFGLL
jgi:hypothetical protein